MKVLVTGASGFVGRHVIRELEDEHELFTPSHSEFSVSDWWRLSRYIDRNNIDAIVHLAALCGGIGINRKRPADFMHANLAMGMSVVHACHANNIKKLVNLGTVCSYPKHTPVPFTECDIWDGYPEETNAPYGIAKKTIIELTIAFHKQYGLNVTNLVPVNMYGEWDNFDLETSHVIPALIRKFEEAQERAGGSQKHISPAEREQVEIWGTGSVSREFLYAGDLARAIRVALERDTGPQPINIGTGKEIRIRDLARLIQKIGNYDSELVWDGSKPDGQPRRCLNISRADYILRWRPTTELQEGLWKTIEWYRANAK